MKENFSSRGISPMGFAIMAALAVVILGAIAVTAHSKVTPSSSTRSVPGSTTRTTGIPGAAAKGNGIPGAATKGNGVPGAATKGNGIPGSKTTADGVPGSATIKPPPFVPNTATTTGATLGNIPAGSLSFRAINRSGNGYITLEEFLAAGLSAELFHKMDANNDGVISKAEYDAQPLDRAGH